MPASPLKAEDPKTHTSSRFMAATDVSCPKRGHVFATDHLVPFQRSA